MGVDHRRRDIGVPEQLLHRADVVPVLEQVRCKAVPQRVATNGLRQAGPPSGVTHRALEQRLVHVIAHDAAVAGLHRQTAGRKDELPEPIAARLRLSAREPRRQRGRAVPTAHVKIVHGLDPREVLRERFPKAPGKHGDPVLHPLPFPDDDLLPLEIQIPHA